MSGCKITFYGGVNEVGGNKILLDDNGTRILLDFGKGFSRRAMFFEEYLKPRSTNSLVALLRWASSQTSKASIATTF